MTNAIPVLVPMENVNDETVVLVQWLVSDGAEVKEGQPIAEMETSKALIELAAPGHGKIAIVTAPGQEVAVGAVVAYLNSEANIVAAQSTPVIADNATGVPNQPDLSRPDANLASVSLPGVRFSKKALDLIDHHGLSLDSFGFHTMVREADVLALLNGVRLVEQENNGLPIATQGVSLAGVTLPIELGANEEGKLDPQFLDYLRSNQDAFGLLSSAEKCDEYRQHGALIGEDVVLGPSTVIVTPHLVLADGVQIGKHSSVNCSERFIVGRLSSFRAGLIVEGATVVIGENVFGCYRVEISGGAANPWSVLYVGDATFIGDDVILDISRPIIVGKEVFLTQRSIIITHNIGQSILEGYENRFEPVVLEDYCQIGMNGTIYAGSRIGSSAIVASNSYVISSIPAGKLAIGVPALVTRDAARPPNRKQQVQIARQMMQDYRELLSLKGYNVTRVVADSFILEHDNKRFKLVFMETYTADSIDLSRSDVCIIWTLETMASPPPACALIDLLTKTIEGVSGSVVDSTREFLRKRGIRCEPGPWRYLRGLI